MNRTALITIVSAIIVAALRKKIERDPAAPVLVLTVRGKGYRWGID